MYDRDRLTSGVNPAGRARGGLGQTCDAVSDAAGRECLQPVLGRGEDSTCLREPERGSEPYAREDAPRESWRWSLGAPGIGEEAQPRESRSHYDMPPVQRQREQPVGVGSDNQDRREQRPEPLSELERRGHNILTPLR